jgi:exosortase
MPSVAVKPVAVRPDWAILAALALLWSEALWRWQAVWTRVPDYGFGWAVPVLAAFLVWERWPDRPAATALPARAWLWIAALVASLALLGILRLFLEPFPLWPAALWLFTAVVLALTLGLLALAYGRPTARHFAFPLAFIVTALPWPAMVDTYFVLPMREILAAIATQMINFAGYPAVSHGTVIQVGAGMVGVDEACSGIRSLQAATMVALFLGELNRFARGRRLALLGVGIALAVGSNLLRTVFLAWQSALHGPAAVEQWHDPAGYALLAVCLGGLVSVTLLWRGHAPAIAPLSPPTRRPSVPALAARLSLALAGAIVAVETGTQLWFAGGELLTEDTPRWVAELPRQRPDFREDPFTPTMQSLLGCDTHQVGHWTSDDGAPRAGYVIGWQRGQTARYTTALHNPSVCLPISGSHLVADRGRVVVEIGALKLPFQAYVFANELGPMHVYYLPWDVRAGQPFGQRTGTRGMPGWIAQQWNEVRLARRNFEATVLTLVVFNAPNDAAADQAMRDETPGIVSIVIP